LLVAINDDDLEVVNLHKPAFLMRPQEQKTHAVGSNTFGSISKGQQDQIILNFGYVGIRLTC